MDRLRIAVCDDEEVFINEVTDHVSRFVEKCGEECEMFGAKSGAELIELCEKHL